MKKIFALILCLVFVFSLVSCGQESSGEEITTLSFKGASSYSSLKKLDGKQVAISGYLATSSPADGSFIFLMNLPYQSCPFCKPNTSQLSNTMEVYPKKGKSFSYTNQAVKVVGTLEVAPSEDEPFTDEYDYEFCFKIVDASYTILKDSELSENMALWQKLAESDVVNDIYSMYDYVYFTYAWNTYFVNTTETQTGFYLYASDAKQLIETDGLQFNYGYKDGYFDGIVEKIESVDASAFAFLVQNVRDAEVLANKALGELSGGEYTREYKYVEKFGTNDYIDTPIHFDENQASFDEIYGDFTDWLGSWEM